MQLRATLLFVLGFAACNKEPAPAQSSAPSAAPAASEQPASRTGLLEEGDAAPQIDAIAHTGQHIKLADFEGRPVVVYFYPKDETKGCIIEAEGIRDAWLDIKKTNAVVLGVSADDNVSHRAFSSNHGLPFLLLPDPKHEIAGAFGVPIVSGRTARVSFVIDEKGEIKKVFPKVSPEGHAQEILAALEPTE